MYSAMLVQFKGTGGMGVSVWEREGGMGVSGVGEGGWRSSWRQRPGTVCRCVAPSDEGRKGAAEQCSCVHAGKGGGGRRGSMHIRSVDLLE